MSPRGSLRLVSCLLFTLAATVMAARAEDFRSLELVATVAGEPLYAACGFTVTERLDVPTSTGLTVPCARMRKELS